jgi:hypothetical protein
MAGDRARITHYAPRKYREVVGLQGRVMLEADWNESQRLFTEQMRLEALDYIGPAGTPDNGYQISAPPADFEIGPGTMYTGGLRTTLEQTINYSKQPDWLDTAQPQPWGDGLWRSPAEVSRDDSHVLLVLREQELTAIEDPALREVALGGPDSAARTRLLQRIVAAPVDGSNCAVAAAQSPSFWSQFGLDYQPASAALLSRARLRVTMVSNPPAPSPCDPQAASGYLGADNQLLRVQVVAFDAATGKGKLLWAYNNGSTLYRCRALDATTIELATRPVSAEYQPRTGAAAQLLMAAADLGEGAYAAALTGHWATLAAPYDIETRRVTLPAALPSVLTPPAGGTPANAPPLFLRLWDQELDFTLDTPLALTNTGLQVTVSRNGAGPLHPGDYWCFGARPATPNAVYPERYLTAAQPPDGPRMWTCPLAVLQASDAAGLRVIDDCRLPFDNLPELTARQPGNDCCCLTIGPKQTPELQAILDKAVQAESGPVTLRLQTGTYALRQPLVIDARHAGLTIAACTGASPILAAAEPEDSSFSYGLLLVLGADRIKFSGIEFNLPAARFDDKLHRAFSSAAKQLPLLRWTPMSWSVGVHAVQCLELDIDDCHFRMPSQKDLQFAAGVLIQGENGKIAIQRCRFSVPRVEGSALVLGVCLAPILRDEDGSLALSSAEVLQIEDCTFSLLHVAMLLIGQAYYLNVVNNITRTVGSSLIQVAFESASARGQDVFEMMERRATDSAGMKMLWALLKADAVFLRAISTALLMALGGLPIESASRGFIYTLGGMKAAQDGRGAAAPGRSRAVIGANHFDSVPAGDNIGGPDTLVWDLDGDSAQLLITGNSFASRSRLPTLTAALDGAFNITGNVIENQSKSTASGTLALLVQPRTNDERAVPQFTVSGNSIFGDTNLAQFVRTEWQQKLNPEFLPILTWEFFNAIR